VAEKTNYGSPLWEKNNTIETKDVNVQTDSVYEEEIKKENADIGVCSPMEQMCYFSC